MHAVTIMEEWIRSPERRSEVIESMQLHMVQSIKISSTVLQYAIRMIRKKNSEERSSSHGKESVFERARSSSTQERSTSMLYATVAEEVMKPDKSINESVNKWEDMDERLNRNKKIALSTLTEVDIRFKWFTAIISGIEFQDMMEDSASTSGNGVVNELNKDEYHLKEIQKILRDGDTVLDLGSNIGLTAFLL
jgi:hypothetical protein